MKQRRIRLNQRQVIVQMQFGRNRRPPTAPNCASNNFTTLRTTSFICTDPSSGCGIFENSLNRPTIFFRFSISASRIPVDS